VPNRAAAKRAPRQVVAPGDDVGARHRAELLGPDDASEAHEVLHRVHIDVARVAVADVGEPFDLGRHIGQLVELGGGQQPGNTGGVDFCRELVAHGRGLTMLPGGTPASFCVRRYSAASSSRSAPLGPQAMRC
jgi:hypothetical protein